MTLPNSISAVPPARLIIRLTPKDSVTDFFWRGHITATDNAPYLKTLMLGFHILQGLLRNLLFSLVAEPGARLRQRDPVCATHFVPHGFGDLVNSARLILHQVKTHHLEDFFPAGPVTGVDVFYIGKLRHHPGPETGFLQYLAPCRLLWLLARINVSFGKRDQVFAVLGLPMATGLDDRHPPLVLHVAQHHGSAGKFSKHQRRYFDHKALITQMDHFLQLPPGHHGICRATQEE